MDCHPLIPLADAAPDQLLHVIHVCCIFFVIICGIGVVISLQREK